MYTKHVVCDIHTLLCIGRNGCVGGDGTCNEKMFVVHVRTFVHIRCIRYVVSGTLYTLIRMSTLIG